MAGDDMNKTLLSILALSIVVGAISIQPVSAAPSHDEIEWVAPWTFPKTREGQLERMLTMELQRKTLLALQEKGYLQTGKENVYSIYPFQVADMREVLGGFYEVDISVSIHQVINNKIEKKTSKYLVTFRHDYDAGLSSQV
jgi:hypothetical protein